MATRDRSVLPGTADLVILRVLTDGPRHGFDVSRTLARLSHGVVELDDAALYQALHRMEAKGWIEGEWGRTDENRRAKFYSLTAKGRRQLDAEVASWQKHAAAIDRILEEA